MGVLRGITWNHTRGYAPMAVTAQIFADRLPDVRIEWDRRSLWAFGEESLDALVAAYDLLVIDHPMIGTAVQAGALLPLDEQLPPAVMARIREGAVGRSQESYHYDGHDYALAVDAACQVAVARPDLLDAAGEDVPTTWSAVVDLARRTRRVALPLNPIDVLSAFLTLCAHLGGPLRHEPDGLCRETGLDALSMLRELAGLVDEPCRSANPIATLNRMVTTDEILYCPLLFGYTNYSREGYAPRRLSFHDIPSIEGEGPRGSCLGGAGIAVSASSGQRDLALAYAQWVSNATTQRTEYVCAGGQPAAAAAWDDPLANALTGDFFRSTRATIDAAYLRPRHPSFPEFQTNAAHVLRDTLLGSVPPGAAIDHLDRGYRQTFESAATSPP
ncbi:extracellular solute-binding protein [Actinopolymorpha sp. B11F2]|uniref:ABC transporter substrate-binding protein n=1 Tax=Actinopolymorpha sp. B11F2 TaxID=3160862 RepID=UPI0032E3C18F